MRYRSTPIPHYFVIRNQSVISLAYELIIIHERRIYSIANVITSEQYRINGFYVILDLELHYRQR